MAIRQATLLIRDKQTTGGALPAGALMAEPFVNLYDGILKFSGVTGGGFEPSDVASVFEVGSTLYNSKITNRLNINDNFIISGDTGLISTYGGSTGAGLSGKFLSGTTSGFVLGNISDIAGASAGSDGDVQFNDGSDGFASDGSFNFNNSTNTLRVSSFSATTLSAGTDIFSGGTSLETIIYNISSSVSGEHTVVQPGSNITTGGTANAPIVSVVDSPSFNQLTTSGLTTVNSNLTVTGLTTTSLIQIGQPGDTGTTATIYGDLLIIGESISGFTSQLYVEDNLVELNYNPTADTSSTSLGAGWSIQDGSGVSGTDVYFDIRGTSTGVGNRAFTTNLANIILSQSGTTSSPDGVYVLKEYDVIDGGSY